MRQLSIFLAVAGLVSGIAFASPTNPQNGADYLALKAPQPVQAAGKKVEVIEFFMYHCPACYALEQPLNDWVKKHANDIVFRRIHIPHNGENDAEAHLFLTLEAMGNEAAMHDKVLHTWHVERRRLMNDTDNIDWAVKNGLDKAKFLGYYNSFAVLSKLKSLSRTVSAYQVESTPTLVVGGRYLTNPAMIDDHNRIPRESLYQATFQTVDALIAKAAKGG